MKTTDEHELKRHGYYYTRTGQVLVLHDWAEGQNGPVFIVTRFYEGEAMDCELTPNGHREITAPYEVEGEKEPVSEIFKELPVFVVDAEYKKQAEKVTALTESLGFLQKAIRDHENKEKSLNLQVSKNEKEFIESQEKLNALLESVEQASDDLNEKKRQISEAQDRLGDLTTDDDSVTISKNELGELRKDQFNLQCLEAGGVDDWEWYGESMNKFRERYPG